MQLSDYFLFSDLNIRYQFGKKYKIDVICKNVNCLRSLWNSHLRLKFYLKHLTCPSDMEIEVILEHFNAFAYYGCKLLITLKVNQLLLIIFTYVSDAQQPLMGLHQERQGIRPLPAKCPSQAIVDVYENKRSKIYSLFCKIG